MVEWLNLLDSKISEAIKKNETHGIFSALTQDLKNLEISSVVTPDRKESPFHAPPNSEATETTNMSEESHAPTIDLLDNPAPLNEKMQAIIDIEVILDEWFHEHQIADKISNELFEDEGCQSTQPIEVIDTTFDPSTDSSLSSDESSLSDSCPPEVMEFSSVWDRLRHLRQNLEIQKLVTREMSSKQNDIFDCSEVDSFIFETDQRKNHIDDRPINNNPEKQTLNGEFNHPVVPQPQNQFWRRKADCMRSPEDQEACADCGTPFILNHKEFSSGSAFSQFGDFIRRSVVAFKASPLLCEFSGKWFCQDCAGNFVYLSPYHLFIKGELKRVRVSRVSKLALDLLCGEPLIDVVARLDVVSAESDGFLNARGNFSFQTIPEVNSLIEKYPNIKKMFIECAILCDNLVVLPDFDLHPCKETPNIEHVLDEIGIVLLRQARNGLIYKFQVSLKAIISAVENSKTFSHDDTILYKRDGTLARKGKDRRFCPTCINPHSLIIKDEICICKICFQRYHKKCALFGCSICACLAAPVVRTP